MAQRHSIYKIPVKQLLEARGNIIPCSLVYCLLLVEEGLIILKQVSRSSKCLKNNRGHHHYGNRTCTCTIGFHVTTIAFPYKSVQWHFLWTRSENRILFNLGVPAKTLIISQKSSLLYIEVEASYRRRDPKEDHTDRSQSVISRLWWHPESFFMRLSSRIWPNRLLLHPLYQSPGCDQISGEVQERTWAIDLVRLATFCALRKMSDAAKMFLPRVSNL